MSWPRRHVDFATGYAQDKLGSVAVNPKTAVALALRVLLLTVVLMILFAVGGYLFVPKTQASPGAAAAVAPQPPGQLLALALFVFFVQTIALAYPIVRSRWGGWRLVATVFAVFYGTGTVTSQIESAVYLGGRMPAGMLAGLFLMGAFTAAIFSPLAVLVLGKRSAETAPEEKNLRLVMPAGKWIWKLAVVALVYVVFYYTFGYFIAWQNPALRAYYGGEDPGSFFAQMAMVLRGTPWMVPLQLLRALLWAALALPVIRMMKGAWWEAGLAVALLFTVPALYLLFPNPLMPETVRLTHLIETAPYQFIFGWIVVWLLHSR